MRFRKGVLPIFRAIYRTRAWMRSIMIACRINKLDANIDQDINHDCRIGGVLSDIYDAFEATDDVSTVM